MHTQPNTHAHTFKYIHNIQTFTKTYKYSFTHTHIIYSTQPTHSTKPKLTNAYSQRNTHRFFTFSQTNTHTDTYTQTCKHTHTHIYTYTHTNTHTHTKAHTTPSTLLRHFLHFLPEKLHEF